MRLFIIGILAFAGLPPTQSGSATEETQMESIKHLGRFQVIEFRRYTIRPSKRQDFANYFESHFPEAFQQLGAIAFGQFLERGEGERFTWLRGFQDMDARKQVNTAFYYGPLWQEHRLTMNDLLVDSDDVLLLTPLARERGVTLLPAVDVVHDPGARGVVVAQIFPVNASQMEMFASRAEELFARYRAAGVREAGVLVTLDEPNNFPQLPVRTDGPYLVWLGIVQNERALEMQMKPLATQAAQLLSCSDCLRGEPELVIMDPTRRSRLRWR